MTIINQLTESEVIPAICDGIKVIRVNLDKMVTCELANKSINTIRNDFGKADYVYFIVTEEAE